MKAMVYSARKDERDILTKVNLSKQDFQRLFRLRQDHLHLKAKMTAYFQRFRNPCRGLRLNTHNSLQFELQDLSSHLRKFKDKLLKVSIRSRSYL